MFLWIYFSCTGSDFALVRRQPPIPGVDDFPRIVNGFYYIFDEMAENRSQRFMVLNEMFNGTQRWQTFSFPIYVDDVPEGVEELNLTLSLVLDPTLPAGSVNVTPAVATVRIQDFSCKLRDRSRKWTTWLVFAGKDSLLLLLLVCFDKKKIIADAWSCMYMFFVCVNTWTHYCLCIPMTQNFYSYSSKKKTNWSRK